MKRFFAAFGLLIPLCMCAQVERNDSLQNGLNQSINSSIITAEGIGRVENGIEPVNDVSVSLRDSVAKFSPARMVYFPLFYRGQSDLFSWNGGGLTAAGSAESLPGLMGIDRGILNLYQHVGNFSFTAYGTATKYATFRGLWTQWGYGGSVTYRFNDNLSLTAFGQYQSQTGIYQPAALGFVGYSSFGGFLNYRFADSKFGVKVGAEANYVMGGSRGRVQPIVMPYYRFNNGAELGVDVGGILFNIFRGAAESRHGNSGNPTIAPPKMGPLMPR